MGLSARRRKAYGLIDDMVVNILYFAWVAETIGVQAEVVDIPDTVINIADLIAWNARRGDGYASAFADSMRIRAAIDQNFVSFDAAITGAKEIAFFPPVTGG